MSERISLRRAGSIAVAAALLAGATSEPQDATHRAAALRSIDPANAIVFAPKNGDEKHRVTIFTDLDCVYCRQFHRQIALVNALGIEVRYVAFPRTGPGTPSWTKAEWVWCSHDRRGMLTRAKRGAQLAGTTHCKAPMVREHYELGLKIGVTGTPAIYSESGALLGGYLPAELLLAKLEALQRARD